MFFRATRTTKNRSKMLFVGPCRQEKTVHFFLVGPCGQLKSLVKLLQKCFQYWRVFIVLPLKVLPSLPRAKLQRIAQNSSTTLLAYGSTKNVAIADVEAVATSSRRRCDNVVTTSRRRRRRRSIGRGGSTILGIVL